MAFISPHTRFTLFLTAGGCPSGSLLDFPFSVCYHPYYMPTPEQRVSTGGLGEQPAGETLDPRHFYAAYVFEYAALRGRDVAVLVDQAHRFECPVRYWWASATTNLKGAFDRLIICVHHPSLGKAVEMHGLLRQAAAKHQVAWDDFEAAALDDYSTYGKVIDAPENIAEPDGTPLFHIEKVVDADALYTLTRSDVQLIAQGMLGRALSDAEMAAVAAELPGVINWMDPIEFTIWTCQQAGNVGRAADGHMPEPES